MARVKKKLFENLRASDYICLGVLARIVSIDTINEVLSQTNAHSKRSRKLPHELLVYYIICLPLYSTVSIKEVLRCVLEGLVRLKYNVCKDIIASKGAISRARSRIGSQPIRVLFEKVCKPLADKNTKGAFFRGRRLVAIDGSTFDVPDEKANAERFGRPGASRGKAALPQIRFAALMEIGTRVIFAAAMDKYKVSEKKLALRILDKLEAGMLCIADRYYMSYELYTKALESGADLLFRAKCNSRFECLTRFKDGSFLSRIYPNWSDKRRKSNGVLVRVIEYRLKETAGSSDKYILVTSILDPKQATARELAALYHQRWEIEIAYDELKCHLKEASGSLRSKTPELIEQEFFAYFISHFVIRSIMLEAALRCNKDPDELSYVHTVSVVRRKIIAGVFPPNQSYEQNNV